MDLLIEGRLWRPSRQAALQAWQRQGEPLVAAARQGEARRWHPGRPAHRTAASRPATCSPPGSRRMPPPLMTGEPSRRILIAGSGAPLTLAKRAA